MREDFFGALENFFWQTCQPRDLDSVTFVRAPWDDFEQEIRLLESGFDQGLVGFAVIVPVATRSGP